MARFAAAGIRAGRGLAYDAGVLGTGRRALARAIVAAALIAGCRGKVPVCPEGLGAPDEARTARVIELVRADPEARDLLQADPRVGVCYAASGEGQVAPGPVLVLSSTEDDKALAARAAHLLLHEREGAVRAVEAGRCGREDLERLRTAEERAWALEGRVRGRLGLAPRPSEAERVAREYEARCLDLAHEGKAR